MEMKQLETWAYFVNELNVGREKSNLFAQEHILIKHVTFDLYYHLTCKYEEADFIK
jgi:hypothetical protein